jgi:hypothetical protein
MAAIAVCSASDRIGAAARGGEDAAGAADGRLRHRFDRLGGGRHSIGQLGFEVDLERDVVGIFQLQDAGLGKGRSFENL